MEYENSRDPTEGKFTMEKAQHFQINEFSVPRFFYGTAWKEERTADLTLTALKAGFTAIDTANQRKHYFEEAVGQGVKKFLSAGTVQRKNLFLQTKFTFARGQDERKPYKETDSYTQQVVDSFTSSLVHLGTDYIDSYVLHGPFTSHGIQKEDLETWRAMEDLKNNHKVNFLGISNVSATQLKSLCEQVSILPTFVQNRCYAKLGWDHEVREFCRAHSMVYQGFSLLTANRDQVESKVIGALAKKYSKTSAQIIFRFCHHLDMITLTGTSNPLHMQQDLNINDFKLSADEILQIERMSV